MIADRDKGMIEMLKNLKGKIEIETNRFNARMRDIVSRIDIMSEFHGQTMSEFHGQTLKSDASADFEKIMTKKLKTIKIKPSITKRCGIDIKTNPVFTNVAKQAVEATPKFRGWEPVKCPKNAVCPKQPGDALPLPSGTKLCTKCDKPLRDKLVDRKHGCLRSDNRKIAKKNQKIIGK